MLVLDRNYRRVLANIRLLKISKEINLKELYEEIYKHNFDVEKYILENRNDMDKMPLADEEYAILKDKFSSNYDPAESSHLDDCSICLDNLNTKNL